MVSEKVIATFFILYSPEKLKIESFYLLTFVPIFLLGYVFIKGSGKTALCPVCVWCKIKKHVNSQACFKLSSVCFPRTTRQPLYPCSPPESQACSRCSKLSSSGLALYKRYVPFKKMRTLQFNSIEFFKCSYRVKRTGLI